MGPTERIIKRIFTGLLGGAFWTVMTLATVEKTAVGRGDYYAAVLIGNAVAVIAVASWTKARSVGVWAAALGGGGAAGLIWDWLPWHSQYWEGSGYTAVLLSFASLALWWAVRGYRYATTSPSVTPPAELWAKRVFIVIVLVWIAVIVYRALS
jgi:hypothetical protein